MSLSILAIGDSYLPSADMAKVLDSLSDIATVRYRNVDPDDRPVIEGIHEYQGSPAAVSAWVADAEVLVVHAAPITAEVLDDHPGVRLVACVRGGAVNIDLAAAEERGIVVVNTPAKNAVSVADLTMTLMHSLFRGVGTASSWLRAQGAAGETHLDSTFIGGQWIAAEPRGATLGLIGFGAIGQRVATQARFYGMRVLAYDPFYRGETDLVELVDLDRLTSESDVISVHAKETSETRHSVSASLLAAMKQGAFLVNTARQSLLDEHALLAALSRGQLGGAALDVCEPDGLWPQLVALPNVILTPHLGGATRQTQERGLEMIVADIRRFDSGESLVNRIA
jgi:D-3-phosphoglycerate dehydrogenase / 2-oxoglutarate reductase